MRWPPKQYKTPEHKSFGGDTWWECWAYVPHVCYYCKWRFWWEPCARTMREDYAGGWLVFICKECYEKG